MVNRNKHRFYHDKIFRNLALLNTAGALLEETTEFILKCSKQTRNSIMLNSMKIKLSIEKITEFYLDEIVK